MHRSIHAALLAAVALMVAPAANAQAGICSRVSPPPSYCYELDEPVPAPPPAPPAPTELGQTAATTSSITLGWTDRASDEYGYTVTRSTPPENVSHEPSVLVSSTAPRLPPRAAGPRS